MILNSKLVETEHIRHAANQININIQQWAHMSSLRYTRFHNKALQIVCNNFQLSEYKHIATSKNVLFYRNKYKISVPPI